MKRSINAAMFWDKLKTKDWLLEHTSLRPAETYAKGLKRVEVPSRLRQVLVEHQTPWAVVKPRIGRNGRGIVMLRRIGEAWETPTKALSDGGLVQELAHDVLPEYPDSYFIEERFLPHPRLERFTFYPDTTPLFRLLFDARQGFIVGALYTASAQAKGFAQILVGGTALWFDAQGIIRPRQDMAPPFDRGRHGGTYVRRTHPETALYYRQFEGLAEFVETCNKEMLPYIAPDARKRWGIDMVVNDKGEQRIVEVNHGPGCQMVGWQGWKPLQHKITKGFFND